MQPSCRPDSRRRQPPAYLYNLWMGIRPSSSMPLRIPLAKYLEFEVHGHGHGQVNVQKKRLLEFL